MYSKKYWLAFLLPFLITACSSSHNAKYKDTSTLERPPEMDIIETTKAEVVAIEKEELTGLGSIVSISGSDEKLVLKIKKMFSRSWNIVEQALNLAEVEITDKNRDKGVFYVTFDPDQQTEKDSGMIDKMTFFLFKDEYEEAAYKLTVVWHESDTQITAELIDKEVEDLLDDGEDDVDAEDSIDSGIMLIQSLYKTIRDDLPLD